MLSDREWCRRRFLAAVAGVSGVSTAGCGQIFDGNGAGTQSGTTSPTERGTPTGRSAERSASPSATGTSTSPTATTPSTTGEPIEIGSRRELFVDEYLIDETDGVRRYLHEPTPRRVVMVHDEPWEGGVSGYHTVFRDGDRYRMYYRGLENGIAGSASPHRPVTCYAESEDGIEWEKPTLGLHEFNGSTRNNIVWDGGASHNFTVFRDPNPDADPGARYKAVGEEVEESGGLMAFGSPDGIEWSYLHEEPILSAEQGTYDTQNTAFWDPVREEYRAYVRDFRGPRRIIETATSGDFREWSGPISLRYPGAPWAQLYTNCVRPYYRAPHILLGFPARYVERDWESPSMKELPGWEERRKRAAANRRFGAAVTDTLFMSSRDGRSFHRWPRAFLRPGLWREESAANWVYGANFLAWQFVETPSVVPGKPRELSFYAVERSWSDASRLRRYTLRIDGFVSVRAPLGGGEFLTRPVRFEGGELVVNFATSAAGSVRVELADRHGRPYPGFSLAESATLFGDDLERVVSWQSDANPGDLAGESVRLRVRLHDADLYSVRFR